LLKKFCEFPPSVLRLKTYLVDPLEQCSTPLGSDAVAVERVLVTLGRLHVREDVGRRLVVSKKNSYLLSIGTSSVKLKKVLAINSQ